MSSEGKNKCCLTARTGTAPFPVSAELTWGTGDRSRWKLVEQPSSLLQREPVVESPEFKGNNPGFRVIGETQNQAAVERK